jgi:hypothetical protein
MALTFVSRVDEEQKRVWFEFLAKARSRKGAMERHFSVMFISLFFNHPPNYQRNTNLR